MLLVFELLVVLITITVKIAAFIALLRLIQGTSQIVIDILNSDLDTEKTKIVQKSSIFSLFL